jgi:Phospholipase_D-nuclease N-terminal
MLLADITFFEAVGAMFAFMFMLAALSLFICLFIDVFQRHDISGWAKAGWILLLFVLPLFGSLIYVVSRASGEVHERGKNQMAPPADVIPYGAARQ